MIYEKTNFLENYQNALKYNDVQGLLDLFTARIAALIVNHKPDVLTALKNAGNPVSPTISNAELGDTVIDSISKGNKNITNAIASLIVTKEGHQNFIGDDAKSGGGGANTTKGKGGKKMTGDQIVDLTGAVATGLGSIMDFAKSFGENKKQKEITKQTLSNNMLAMQQQAQNANAPVATGLSTGAKVGIGVAIVVVIAAGVGFFFWQKNKKGAAVAAPAAASGTGA
jgi:hypothetical protein